MIRPGIPVFVRELIQGFSSAVHDVRHQPRAGTYEFASLGETLDVGGDPFNIHVVRLGDDEYLELLNPVAPFEHVGEYTEVPTPCFECDAVLFRKYKTLRALRVSLTPRIC